MARSVMVAIKEIKKPTIKVPPGLGKSGRPKKVSRDPKRKLGPRWLRLGSDPALGNDWCKPWPTFVTATTSLSEQMLYAAIALYFGNPKQFWLPPYSGGLEWKYQTNIGGGRLIKGGQVCDFEVTFNAQKNCVRLQSSRWHVLAEHAKQVDDLWLKTHTGGLIVRDIYEQDFIQDCTLQTAVAIFARTIGGQENNSPIMFGTGRQVRKPA